MSGAADIQVKMKNFVTETYAVHFRYWDIPFYEVFRSKEEAEFWAEKLKTGEWDPSETSPTKALRKALEDAS